MVTKKSPKKSPTSKPSASPRSTPKAPKKSPKTADEVRALIREKITASGAVAIADLASDDVHSRVLDWVSSQSLALDDAMGTPGYPTGRITEIYGQNHGGKTTLLAHAIAEVQRRGGVAYVLDQEMSLDKDYMTAIGVDIKAVEIVQPKDRTIEAGVEAMEPIVDELARYPDMLALFGWDTIAAAPSARELEEDFGKVQPGHVAKAIKSFSRRAVAKIANTRIALMILNQSYMSIGKVFGDPEKANGGEGLAFFSSMILRVKRGARLPDDVPGNLSYVTVKKSKVSSATNAQATLAFARGQGIDNTYTLYDTFDSRKLITRGGGSCSVRLSETEDLKWRGGWPGLAALCARDHSVYLRLVDAYRAIRAQERGVKTAEESTS